MPIDEFLLPSGCDNLVPGQDPEPGEGTCRNCGRDDSGYSIQSQLKQWWRGNSDIPDKVVAHEPPLFQLPLERIKLTTTRSFWTAVKHAANGDGLWAALDDRDPAWAAEGGPRYARLAADLQSTVVMMPRFFLKMYGIGGGDYNSMEDVVTSVQRFLDASGAISLPPLDEYAIMLDKVQLHQMYRAYYDEDPVHRVPPIPTAYVGVEGGRLGYLALKYNQLTGRHSKMRPSQQLVENIQHSLWRAMRELEEDIASFPAREGVTGARVVTKSKVHGGLGAEETRHYFLKREFSEGCHSVMHFRFPLAALLLEQEGDLDAPSFRGDAPWRAKPALPAHAYESLEHDFEVCEASGADPSTCWGSPQLPFMENPPFLEEIAVWLAEQSCGENFLLQPKIRDMRVSEYRVFLVGGAEAKGLPNDTVVAYTPADNEGWNHLALPFGYFSSNLNYSGKPSSQAMEGGARKPYPWPEMHETIVNAAKDGAQAAAQYKGGMMRALGHVFARIDVVLAPSDRDLKSELPDYETEGGKDITRVQPFVNEVESWLFGAGIFVPFWKDADTTQSLNTTTPGDDEVPPHITESWGFRFAEKLLRETILTRKSSS